MTKSLRSSLAILALAMAAPLASVAQGIPGFTCTTQPNGNVICVPNVPEIGASASIGGVTLLLCGALMLRGRKRNVAATTAA